jgi:hypothetical protein
MATTIKMRGDTAANWTSANPTLAARELGFETDTLQFKMGDGTTSWTSLAYVTLAVAAAGTLGAAPSYMQFKRLTGPPDELYVSLQGSGGWEWVNLGVAT